jgi:hypothetical protein
VNALLWVTVLLCWGTAALLVASLAFPRLFETGRDRDVEAPFQ